MKYDKDDRKKIKESIKKNNKKFQESIKRAVELHGMERVAKTLGMRPQAIQAYINGVEPHRWLRSSITEKLRQLI
jgi:hypothetical protein